MYPIENTFGSGSAEILQRLQDPSSDHRISFHFLAIFAAVLFTGSVVCPRYYIRNAFGDVVREDLSTRLYKGAMRAIRMADFPRSPSVQSLTAFIIVNATWLRAEQPLACCPFVAVAVRVAQMVGRLLMSWRPQFLNFLALSLTYSTGLHKEPSKFPDMDPVELHVRRQLWWNLVSLDAQIALASGLPCILETSFYDVEPIAELSESAVACVSAEGAITIKEILRAFVGGKFEFYRMTGTFLHLLHKNTMDETDPDKILEIARGIQVDMYSRRERIALVMQSASDNGGSLEASAVLSKFSKMVMSMLAAKPFSVMYGPVRRHGLLGKLLEKKPTYVSFLISPLHST